MLKTGTAEDDINQKELDGMQMKIKLEGNRMMGHMRQNNDLHPRLTRFKTKGFPNTIKVLSTKLPKVENLRLDFINDGINDDGMRLLRHRLENQTRLLNLNLSFIRCPQINDKGLERLGECLKSLPALQNLSLTLCNIGRYGQITHAGIKALSASFRYLSVLKCLTLEFKHCLHVTDRELKIINEDLRYLHSLRRLTLEFSSCDFTNKGLKYFSFRLPLQSLALIFNYCTQIDDNGLEYLSEGLKSLSTLESFTLKFYYCQSITSLGLEALGTCFRSLSSLSSLHLHFKDCQLTNKELKVISEFLSCLYSLYSLTLDLSYNSITNEGLRFLSFPISLQSLTLDFTWCPQINDQGLKIVSESFKTLSSLKSLTLILSMRRKSRQITDVGLEALDQAFKSLPFLENLALDLTHCNSITEKGFTSFIPCLNHFSSLHSLVLDLCGCKKIKIKGIKSLSESLRSLASLRSFTLKFFSNTIGLKTLGECFKYLSALQTLTLNFSIGEKMTDTGIKALGEDIMSLPSLLYLDLCFHGCRGINKQTKANFAKHLKSKRPFKIISVRW